MFNMNTDYSNPYWNDRNYSQLVPSLINLDGYSINNSGYSSGKFSISFLSQKNRLLQDYELMPGYFKGDHTQVTYIDSSNLNTYDIRGESVFYFESFLKYQIHYNIINKDCKLLPFIGIGSNLFIQNERYTSMSSFIYPRKFFKAGFDFFACISLMYNINEKMFCMINMPFRYTSVYTLINYIGNPYLPQALMRTTTINIDYFPEKYSFRFGIGFKL
ncbi:MAG: hypothetical protein ABIJ97_04330 [Bacteroidota bacterium]